MTNNTEPLKVGEKVTFEQMNPLQRRLHNAACVLDADGDEYGYVNLLRETIAELTRTEPSPARVEGELTDEAIKELIDGIDFKQMVTADDMFYLIARAIERALTQRLAVKEGETETNANRYLAIRGNALAKHTAECGRIPDATRFNKGYDEAADYMVKHGPANHIAYPAPDDQQAKDAELAELHRRWNAGELSDTEFAYAIDAALSTTKQEEV